MKLYPPLFLWQIAKMFEVKIGDREFTGKKLLTML
jgi:hypothetical protein